METPLRNIDLNLLILFDAVYTTGSLSKAAQRLHMTQPGVSNGLARLRELTGDPLFTRVPRGVEPTAKARHMIDAVRDALRIISGQFNPPGTLDPATLKRDFRILMIDAYEPIVMPPVLRTIARDAPGVSVESVAGHHGLFVEDLRAGTLDLACFVFPGDSAEIVAVPIAPLDLVVVARADHPGIVRRPLDAATYRSLSHVTLTSDLRAVGTVDADIATSRMAKRHVPYRVGKVWSMPPIVARTDLIGILPRRFAEAIAGDFGLEIHPLPVPTTPQYVYLMWHARNDADPAHRWLREVILAAAVT